MDAKFQKLDKLSRWEEPMTLNLNRLIGGAR
jgi:hypothetical protein